MKRKILALVLATLMICSSLPVLASAHSASLLKEEVLNNDVYYHMDYVEKENFFKNHINLYTALGLYDGAWYNYFTEEVDIDYATTILLALIEKVDVEYQNEDFETFIKVLEGASSVADVINKVNEYTGILDFAESNEWATSISVLNNLIKVANYGNEMYEAFIRGYASILSARAASLYYSDLLQTLVDNCQNTAVKAAAAEILENINSALEDAVKKLVEELVYSAGQDAVSVGVDIAMSTNTVTAAIKSAYKTSTNLSEKLFKTSSKYGYMCSLAEIYYVEDCLIPWAEAKLALGDDEASMKDFAISAMLSLRESGESLLAGLAATKDKTLEALTSNYNVQDIKIRTASTIAKLGVIRSLIEADVNDNFVSIITATGDSKAILRDNGNMAAYVGNGEELALTQTTAGYIACVYSEVTGNYIKVAVLNDSANAKSLSLYTPVNSARTYMQLDSVAGGALLTKFANVVFKSDRSIVAEDLTAAYTADTAPAVTVTTDGEVLTGYFTSEFSTNAIPLYTAANEVDNNAQVVDVTVKSFFQKIKDFFLKLFNIFK